MSEIIDTIKNADIFRSGKWEERTPRRYYIQVDAEKICEAVKELHNAGCRFSILSGIDHPDTIELMYHFSFDNEGIILNIVTFISKGNPEIASITSVIKEAAEWIEREVHELLGVDFKGHPGLTPLLLAENWPKECFPLRKDAQTPPFPDELKGRENNK